MERNFVEYVNPQDNENLLDPRVAQGEDGIARILQYLGASKDIVTNPRVKEYLNRFCKRIFTKTGIKLDEPKTLEENKRRAKAIEESGVLEDSEIAKKIDGRGMFNGDSRISIDEQTGTVKCQTLDNGASNEISNIILEFSVDGNGNVIRTLKSFVVSSDGKSELRSEMKVVYDKNGICMQIDDIDYQIKDGVPVIKRKISTKRDSECPLIASREDGNTKKEYYPIIRGKYEGLTPERNLPDGIDREWCIKYINRQFESLKDEPRSQRYKEAIGGFFEQVDKDRYD